MFQRFFSISDDTEVCNSQSQLNVDSLEDRMMLSSVQIYAAGATGSENLELKINDVVAATFENIGGDVSNREFQQLSFETDQQVTASQIRLQFINDLYRPEDGFDRNVVIDRIVVDGLTYETESPSTYSTGVWRDGGVSEPGFLETETLNINGSFFYSDDGVTEPPVRTGTILRIEALGSTGAEQLQVRIDGNVVDSFDVTTSSDSYFYVSDDEFSVDQVQLEFTNDLYDPNAGIDRNLIVEQIQLVDRQTLERQRFFTDSDSTFSTGTWLASDGVVDGFGRGDTLHTNGYFRHAQSGISNDSLAIDLSFGEDGFTSGNGASFSIESAVSPTGTYARIGFSGDPFAGTSTTDLLLFDASGALINQTVIGAGGRQQPRINSIDFGSDESVYINLDYPRSSQSEIIKLTSSGDLDTTFGTNGKLRLDGIYPSSFAITSDGSLITGGQTFVPFEPTSMVLMKRDAQGNLMETFGSDGTTGLNFGTLIIGTVPTSDGGVYFAVNDGQTGSRTVTRIAADGTLVSSFGFNGSIFLEPQDSPNDVVLVDSQDRLILATRFTRDRTEIKRFNADGKVDTSFGDNGTVTLSPDFWGLDVDPQDRVVGYANVLDGAATTVNIFRLGENGNLDASFDDDGLFVTAADVQSNDFNQRISYLVVGDDGSTYTNSFSGIRKYVPV